MGIDIHREITNTWGLAERSGFDGRWSRTNEEGMFLGIRTLPFIGSWWGMVLGDIWW